MMLIGLTQRVEEVVTYGEKRDCLDHRWFRLLESSGFIAIPVPNGLSDVDAWTKQVGLAGVVLTGGNDLSGSTRAKHPAPERDATETSLLTWAEQSHMPVLGVCRGLQFMNKYLGGDVTPISGHVACRHKVHPMTDDTTFGAIREVNSFHGWGIHPAGLAPSLTAYLQASDGTIEAAGIARRLWFGIMWHPEREQPFNDLDRQLLTRIFKTPKV